ncbi:hypothetical protein [Dickeya dianthicola]|uniref:hypothetical protein n=1 Tax=Dickeya dianthicola TaxID=204039 RepID=UPI0013703F28|nr:hypothetical protein [Dickeya dianthicola]MCI4234330.1 hypothetical protein [Dickeya dianthicola]
MVFSQLDFFFLGLSWPLIAFHGDIVTVAVFKKTPHRIQTVEVCMATMAMVFVRNGDGR